MYEIYSKDNRVYNGIVWQFPLALITVNALSIAFLWDKPFLLPILPIINFALLHALFKLGHNQGAIIDSLKGIENDLKSSSNQVEAYIPKFEKDRPWILGVRSRALISWTLLALNIFFIWVSLMAAGLHLIKIAFKAFS